MTEPTGKSAPTGPYELLEGLSDRDRRSILSTASQRSFAVDHEIFAYGEPKEFVYLLLNGLAKVSQVDRNGNEAILWLNGSGQVIGAANLVPGGHSATARTIQPCNVAIWGLLTFESMLEQFPLLWRNVERIIARQTMELSSRICEIGTAPSWFCLGKTLLRLSDQIGQSVDREVVVKLTQECLAEMTGTTIYNVNRQLLFWEQNGLVLRQRRRIVIRDLPGLRSLCSRSTDRPPESSR